MLPVGTSIEPWLQDFTAWFIHVGLQLTNIPHIYLHENYQIVITQAHGKWPRTAEAYVICSLFGTWICLRDVIYGSGPVVFLSRLCAVVLMAAMGSGPTA